MNMTANRCPPYALKARLLELLRAGPTTSDDLARLTRYSGNAVRKRLADLRVDGYVTREIKSRADGGMNYVWTANAGRQLPRTPEPDTREPTGFGKPRQIAVQQYPIFHQRDFLVAALFGPAP